MRVIVLCALCVSALAGAVSSVDSDNFGLPSNALPMLKCTACERAVGLMQNKLSQLILDDKTWSKAVKKEVWTAMKKVCTNQDIFPSGGENVYLKACAVLMRDHHKQILGAFRRRLLPDNEQFHEDIAVRSFCREIDACAAGVKSMDEALSGAQHAPPEKKSEL